jgi:hypothetical protein
VPPLDVHHYVFPLQPEVDTEGHCQLDKTQALRSGHSGLPGSQADSLGSRHHLHPAPTRSGSSDNWASQLHCLGWASVSLCPSRLPLPPLPQHPVHNQGCSAIYLTNWTLPTGPGPGLALSIQSQSRLPLPTRTRGRPPHPGQLGTKSKNWVLISA